MKKTLLLTLMFVTVTTLPSCRRSSSPEVVKVSYLHKYGVPVSESDWIKQGKEGQVVEMTSDGVTSSKSYVAGILHGVTTHTYPNSSTLHFKERYDEGRLISRCEMYPSGMPHYEESYDQGECRQRISWYEQGTPKMSEQYQGKFLVQGEYRNLSNEVESRVEEGEGVRIDRNHEGDLVLKERIVGGELSERVIFYPHGEPKEILPFERGVVHGTKLTFLPGALPHSVEQWVNGQQEGITLLYQNGERIAAVPYVKGKREGVAYSYRNGEDVAEEVTWKNDKMHGKRTLFIEEGATKVEWYLEGELVNKMTFDRLNLVR